MGGAVCRSGDGDVKLVRLTLGDTVAENSGEEPRGEVELDGAGKDLERGLRTRQSVINVDSATYRKSAPAERDSFVGFRRMRSRSISARTFRNHGIKF